MDTTFKLFLILHIIGGSLGLLTGLFNILRTKGDKIHKLVGKVFYYSMFTAGVSSLVLSVLHPNYFLFMVGVFTLYMIITGTRYLALKGNNTKPASIDWAVTVAMLIAGVVFSGIGIWQLVGGNFFGLVFLTFGFFGLRFARTDLKNYKGESAIKNFWLIGHLQRMTGGFIAALTAFLVVNAKYLPEQVPGYLYWLLPTILLTPVIVRWSRKMEVKKKPASA